MEVSALLPHRAPMLLLDRIISYTDEGIECVVKMSDTPFVANGFVDIIVATEWMAQAVGAFVGASRQKKGETPRIGFIIGIRRVDFHVGRVKTEDELRVHAEPVWIDRGNGNFRCRVEDFSTGHVIAEGSLTVHEPEN